MVNVKCSRSHFLHKSNQWVFTRKDYSVTLCWTSLIEYFYLKRTAYRYIRGVPYTFPLTTMFLLLSIQSGSKQEATMLSAMPNILK